ncbi:hypothetical protein Tco_0834734, partial [Tanacetum coccineum]
MDSGNLNTGNEQVTPDKVVSLQTPLLRFHNTHLKVLLRPNTPCSDRALQENHCGSFVEALEDGSSVEAIAGTALLLPTIEFGYASVSTFLVKTWIQEDGTFDKTFSLEETKKAISCWFNCLQIKQNKEGIFISQDKYIAEILKKFDLVNVKAAITPMETKLPLTKDEEAFDVDVHLYRSMIGNFKDFSSQYLSRDLKKSTTGGCQFLGQRLISWQCMNTELIVATSTTEVNIVACCKLLLYGNIVLWVQRSIRLDYRKVPKAILAIGLALVFISPLMGSSGCMIANLACQVHKWEVGKVKGINGKGFGR